MGKEALFCARMCVVRCRWRRDVGVCLVMCVRVCLCLCTCVRVCCVCTRACVCKSRIIRPVPCVSRWRWLVVVYSPRQHRKKKMTMTPACVQRDDGDDDDDDDDVRRRPLGGQGADAWCGVGAMAAVRVLARVAGAGAGAGATASRSSHDARCCPPGRENPGGGRWPTWSIYNQGGQEKCDTEQTIRSPGRNLDERERRITSIIYVFAHGQMAASRQRSIASSIPSKSADSRTHPAHSRSGD